MEKDFGSWFHNQHSGRQSPNLNHLSSSFEVGWQNSISAYASNANPCFNELSNHGTFPAFGSSGLPQLNQPWVHTLPQNTQAFAHPKVNSSVPLKPTENYGRTGILNADITGSAQKKFLVFDQSGDQTTLIYSSGIGAPVQCLKSWNPNPPVVNDPIKEDFGAKRYMLPHFNPFGNDLYNEGNQRGDEDELESQMHEDTEELNALLYSDDESESSEDDEVTSTGHSPSSMTEHGIQDSLEEGEEVASSASPCKKRRLSNGEFDVHSPKNAPMSKKPSKLSDPENDAESSCGNFDHDQVSEESNSSLSGKKRSRKEKIRETVSILQSIIPNGKGKDGMVVIDDAIRYLKSLKVQAKALGFDTL